MNYVFYKTIFITVLNIKTAIIELIKFDLTEILHKFIFSFCLKCWDILDKYIVMTPERKQICYMKMSKQRLNAKKLILTPLLPKLYFGSTCEHAIILNT